MSRKHSLRLDRQLDALMLFAYCKMLLSSDLFMFVFKCQPSWSDFTTNIVGLLLQRCFFSCFINGVFSALKVYTILVDVRFLLILHMMFWNINMRSSKPLTHSLPWCLGVWSSAVNHRFGFAYLEDAVTSSNNTAL